MARGKAWAECWTAQKDTRVDGRAHKEGIAIPLEPQGGARLPMPCGLSLPGAGPSRGHPGRLGLHSS